MKQILLIALSALGTIPFARGQVPPLGPQPDRIHAEPSAQVVGVPGNGVYAVTEVGPHHRRWQRVVTRPSEQGKMEVITNSYVELGTGMNAWSKAERRWAPASDEIEIFDGAAVSRQAQHEVVFSANLADGNGTIDLLTSDGYRLRCSVVGLAYTDSESGKSLFIAEIKDVPGLVVGANQVIYVGAFDSVLADVRYTTTRSSFEADVVLRESIPPPESFGLNPKTTRLEVWTEFFDPPEPLRPKTASGEGGPPDLEDDEPILEFGTMRIIPGRAFSIAAEDAENSPYTERNGRHVNKAWETVDRHVFLIEGISYEAVRAELAALPEAQARKKVFLPATALIASSKGAGRKQPQSLLAKSGVSANKDFQIARASSSVGGRGFVLDWVAITSTSNFTFAGDTTYLVESEVFLSGTTTIEGGAVVKFGRSPHPTNYVWIALYGPTVCKTSPYRPLILTAKDDNTVGDTIPGSTGTPTGYYSYYGLAYRYGSDTISNVRARNIYLPFSFYYGTNYVVDNSQAINSYVAIGAYGANVFARNMLAHNAYLLFSGPSPEQPNASSASFEHLTAHQLSNLSLNPACCVTNSLLIAVTNVGTISGSHNATNGSATGVLQTVGAGNHYLAAGSSHRNTGTTNIHPGLLASLRTRTTYPPVVLASDFTLSTSLGPQAQRDADTPDLGYHYDSIDYCLSGSNLTNATLLLTNGVVVAAYGNRGLVLRNGAQLVSEGSPNRPNRLIRFDVVQEQPYGPWANPGLDTPATLFDWGSGNLPFSLRFTEFSCLAGNYAHWVFGFLESNLALRDCELFGGIFLNKFMNPNGSVIGLTNCLFHRVQTTFGPDTGAALQLFGRNNLFRFGTLDLRPKATNVWGFYDNAFDGVMVIQNATSVPNGYNAYINSLRLIPNGAGDLLLGSFAYQSGALGDFYHGQTNLANAGGRLASAATLYHHTTSISQTKEANSVVDIGFHYASLDGANEPADSDGDGAMDAAEDRNGDGLSGSGETDWQSSTDLGFKVLIQKPSGTQNLP